MKSSLSVKSRKSQSNSMKTMSNIVDEKQLELNDCLIKACNKFCCSYLFSVKKEFQNDPVKLIKQEESAKYTKIRLATPYTATEVITPTVESSVMIHNDDEENVLKITAVYDNMNCLVEVSMYGEKEIPRIMMRIIGVIVPYFKTLAKVSIRNCRINAYVIYELSKMLTLSSITDICLDDSPLKEANYAILLTVKSQLNNLSLRRCKINDDVCNLIAAELHFGSTAETNLYTLNLSSNHITDIGADYLAEALRTNRHLRYLNLADNRITDDGAGRILYALKDFPLTNDEIIDKRRRYYEYWKARKNLYLKFLNDYDSSSLDGYSQVSKKSSPTKKRHSATSLKSKAAKKDKCKDVPQSNDDYITSRAETLAAQMMGTFFDPYDPSATVIKNDQCFSIGNLTLCYLNLSYNNLTYLTIQKIKAVIISQNVNKKPGQNGLIKLVIEGNNMPIDCDELRFVSDTLLRTTCCFGAKTMSELSGRRKSRSTRISGSSEQRK